LIGGEIQVATREPSKPKQTKLTLMRAAERLFAEHGVDHVSLREVSVAAGQKNHSAAVYHFGSREGLIDAILARHARPLHFQWVAYIETLAREGSIGVRPLIEFLIRGIAAKLDDADGGIAWISISAQLNANPTMPLSLRPISMTPEVLRLSEALLSCAPIEPSLIFLRVERVLSVLFGSLLNWARLESSGATMISREAFISDLIDTTVALIEVPPSLQTRVLLDQTT
jgi:AcrR family transcriptional regulator